MAYRAFLVLILVASDCLSFDASRRVIDDQFDADEHLGYFLKSAKQERDHERTRQNAIGREERKLELRSGASETDEEIGKTIVASLDPRRGPMEDLSAERVKNDSALPLHVTSSARQECLDGYEADENGTCQKSLAPKGEKSFKLRRRKRGEQPQPQPQPKLSYADIVKFGSRHRPLTIPFVAEILTTQKPEMRKDTTTVMTTIKPAPSEAASVTTPAVKAAEPVTTLPPKTHSSLPTEKVGAVTSKVAEATTASPALAKSLPTEKVVETPTTVKPGVASVKKDEPITTLPTGKTITTAAQTVKHSEAVTPTAVTTPVNKAHVTATTPTAKPAAAAPTPAPTRPASHLIPTILTKIPNRAKSILGDLNKAFLSGEKMSIAAQSSDPAASGGNPPAGSRLRRQVGFM